MKDKITIAIDAMGGDNAPNKTIEGLGLFLNKNKKKNDFQFKLYGDEDKIKETLKKYKVSDSKIEIHNTLSVVSDKETPLTAIKNSKNSSMWKSINSQIEDNSNISLSAGNTGVLFVISKMLLKTIEGVSKPALAGVWPSKKGMSVVLDLGANIECNEKNLIDFSEMGSALYRSLFPKEEVKVSLLNIGSEELKGNEVIKNTYQKLNQIVSEDFEFIGFIEGNHLMDGNVNVIVADGFTGNVALKTAEGTANFITSELKNVMTSSLLSKIGSIISFNSLKKFKKKLDPRLYNGAILLGLNSPVIKSHGGTDYFGFANSLSVCEKIVKNNLIDKIKSSIN